MSTLYDASIVVRCYNEEKRIGQLLEGLFAQRGVTYEVIIVDSGSTDKTLEICQQFPTRIVSIPKSEFSFGRALNTGCGIANGNFLVFISAHCYPLKTTWLSELLSPLRSDKVALSYGKQRGGHENKFSEFQIFASAFPESSNPRQVTPFCNNANSAIPKRLWLETPFDEELTGLEDLDWANKMIKRGFYLSYISAAEIVHIHEENLRQIYLRYLREGIAFHRIFPEHKFTITDFIYFFIKNSLYDLKTTKTPRMFLKNLAPIIAFRFLQFFGTYIGHQYQNPSLSLRNKFYYPPGHSRNSKNTEECSSKNNDFINYKS